jgi:AraC family transcriptional regulator
MLRSLESGRPVSNAKPVRTADYSVEIQRSGPATLPAIYHNLHMVMVCLSGEALVVRANAVGQRTIRFVAGESSVHTAGPGDRVMWPSGVHCLYVHLHPRLIRRLGKTMYGVPALGLETRDRLHDRTIREIGLQLHNVVTAASRIDMKSAHDLVMALAHHVVANHPAANQPAAYVGKLSIEEVLDVIREDAPSWNGVAALAARAGLTRSHFTRRIRRLTGVAPYAMVLRSRVEAAKHLLEQREMSLSEVAYATGFADQSHITRVFKQVVGITPALYARR